MSRLDLRFLGSRSLILNSDLIKITADTQWALLAWIGMQADATHSRDVVTTLLWPEHSEVKARANMRKTLSRLRKLLPEHLHTTRTTVELEGNWSVDVVQFEQAIATSDFAQAVRLYNGDFLTELGLNSAEFQEWALLKREYLRREYTQALAQLTTSAIDRADYSTAYQHAWKRTEIDRFDEPAHCHVMLALAHLNRKHDALAQYDRLRQLLAGELGIAPAAQTTALYEKIKRESARSISVAQPKQHVAQHNLPIQHTPFVGRKTELRHLAERLHQPSCHLLTLLGMGGIGKTRLALELARQQLDSFPDGVWFVPLANIPNTGDVDAALVNTIANAVGIEFTLKITTNEQRRVHLLTRLKSMSCLLLLDNMEHLVEHVGLLVSILAVAPAVKLLVTTREPLNLRAEWSITLDGLPFPDEADDMADNGQAFDAVALFNVVAERVSMVQPTQGAVARITQLVMGMPLAIELAASWITTFSAQAIAQRIEQDANFLRAKWRDTPSRHRSLRAVFDTTLALLTTEEHDIFIALGVFKGGFTSDAATRVVGASPNILRSLADRALIRQFDTDRFVIHPLIGQFLAEKSAESPTYPAFEQAHAGHYLQWITSTHGQLSPDRNDPHAKTLRLEQDNCRQAWHTALARGAFELLSDAIKPAYQLGFLAETWRLLDEWFANTIDVLEARATRSKLEQTLLIRSIYGQARMYKMRAELDIAVARALAALALAQQLDDREIEVECRVVLGGIYIRQHALDSAETVLLTALDLCATVSDTRLKADTHHEVGQMYMHSGRYPQAIEQTAEAHALYTRLNDPAGISITANTLGGCNSNLGDYAQAQIWYTKALADIETITMATAPTYGNYGLTLFMLDEHAQAIDVFKTCQTVFQQGGDLLGMTWAMSCQASSLVSLGGFWEAHLMSKEALAICKQINAESNQGLFSLRLGADYWHMGQFEQAKAHLELAISISRARGYQIVLAQALAYSAHVSAEMGDLEVGLAQAREALDTARQMAYPFIIGLSLSTLGQLLLQANVQDEALEALQEASTILTAEKKLHWMEADACLAKIYASQGDQQRALDIVDKLLDQIDGRFFFKVTSPIQLFDACHQVLQHAQDPRAAALRDLAMRQINFIADQITDAHLRDSYLHNTAAQRRLLSTNHTI